MSTELKNCLFDMFAHLAKNCEYCIKDVFLGCLNDVQYIQMAK